MLTTTSSEMVSIQEYVVVQLHKVHEDTQMSCSRQSGYAGSGSRRLVSGVASVIRCDKYSGRAHPYLEVRYRQQHGDVGVDGCKRVIRA